MHKISALTCLDSELINITFFYLIGTLGASTNPCSHNYAGVAPFSEPETRAIADYMQEELLDKLHIFLDFHSYSQRWLTPWGYTASLPNNYAEQVSFVSYQI